MTNVDGIVVDRQCVHNQLQFLVIHLPTWAVPQWYWLTSQAIVLGVIVRRTQLELNILIRPLPGNETLILLVTRLTIFHSRIMQMLL